MKVVLKDNSEAVLSALDKALERGLEAIGMVAEGHAKEETPVDTGRLRNSMSNAVQDKAVYIGSNVDYAAYV